MEAIPPVAKTFLLVLAMLCAEKSNADKSASSSANNGEPDQDVMMIMTKAPRNTTLPLENVKRRTIGTRTFLVGTMVDPFGTNSHLTAMVGKTVWVSTEEIGMVYVFEGVEDMKKSVNPSRPAASIQSEEPGILWSQIRPSKTKPPPSLPSTVPGDE